MNCDVLSCNFTGGIQKPRAHGVIFKDANGVDHRAYLKRGSTNEILVSSGSLGSPQLLMLSGVGPRRQLKAHNITMVLEQPMVGLGMSDNPMNAVFVPSPQPVEVSLIQIVGITRNGTYIESACGENFAGGARTLDYGMFSPKVQISAVGPHLKTIYTLGLGKAHIHLGLKPMKFMVISFFLLDWTTIDCASKTKNTKGDRQGS